MTICLAVFGAGFLAATILPLHSEAVVAALARTAATDPGLLWVAASLGNILGAVLNWCLGRYLLRWQNRTWFPVSADRLGRSRRWFGRYGVWALLLAWLPVVGDPLTFVAGMLRVNLLLFIMLTGIGKIARYGVVIALAMPTTA